MGFPTRPPRLSAGEGRGPLAGARGRPRLPGGWAGGAPDVVCHSSASSACWGGGGTRGGGGSGVLVAGVGGGAGFRPDEGFPPHPFCLLGRPGARGGFPVRWRLAAGDCRI